MAAVQGRERVLRPRGLKVVGVVFVVVGGRKEGGGEEEGFRRLVDGKEGEGSAYLRLGGLGCVLRGR